MPDTEPRRSQDPARSPGRLASFWEDGQPLVMIADPVLEAPAELLAICRDLGIRTVVEPTGAGALIAYGRQGPDVLIVSERISDVPWSVIAPAVAADSGKSIPVLLVLGTLSDAPAAKAPGPVDEIFYGYAGITTSASFTRLAKGAPVQALRDPEIVYSSLIMRPAAFEVRDQDTIIPLTLREFELLRVLMLHAGRTVPLEQLKSEVWGAVGETVKTDTLRVHMVRIRHKLTGSVRLAAVRGVGYRLQML